METLFLVCGVVGCALVACQFLLGLLGLGGDAGHDVGHDVGHDIAGHDGGHDAGGHDSSHDHSHEAPHSSMSSWIFGWLTFRALSAALAFFGLSGLAALHADLDAGPALVIALATGIGALVAVASLVRNLGRFNVDGTARIDRTVGCRGTVYLSIPGQHGGAGKVHVSCQNRLLECKAVTAGDRLPTGSKIVVAAVVSSDTVEVEPIPVSERERVHHV